MKRFLPLLLLLVTASPLFANDEGGDVAYIPDYRELVREGYGPRIERQPMTPRDAPKPTQAYYGKGFTVYYGYTTVATRTGNPNMLYAFGYPVDYFRQMMPVAVNETNLNRYAVALQSPYNSYGPGNFVAEARKSETKTTTTVQSTRTTTTTSNGAAPLPAIGEKPAH